MRKTIFTSVLAIAMALSTATAAIAVSATFGNAATDRPLVDSWQNFTIVDTNNPAPFDGVFSQINYYAERPGRVRFVLVDAADNVTWVSDVFTAGAAGSQVALLDAPAGVTAGSNLGVFSVAAGVVSYGNDTTAEPAEFENFGAGLPTVGEVLTYVGESRRVYSMNAQITATSPDICKNGGWETYEVYKNQGQCIASVVANDHAGKE